MKNYQQKRAVVSLSGGLDSASLLVSLLADGYQHIHCYGFNYGQRHAIEIIRARKLIQILQERGFPVDYQVINVEDVFSDSQSALSGEFEVPKEEYSLEVSKVTVVENRNVIFSAIIYGKALAISKKFDIDVDIALGVHSGDHAVYPDCKPESVNMARELFRISNWGSERIDYRAPFVNSTKGETLAAGINALRQLGFNDNDIQSYYRSTSSCYDPVETLACGLCATCRDRLSAFEFVGMKDPVDYVE